MPAWDRAWRQATNTLARQASSRVAAAWVAHSAGRLSYEEAVSVMASILAGGQRRAVTMNDVLLAQELASQLAMDVRPTGIDWPQSVADQTSALAKSVDTVLGTDVAYVQAAPASEQAAMMRASVAQRLGRLSDTSVWGASQYGRQEAAMAQAGPTGVVGYFRVLNPGACELCVTIGGSPASQNIRPLTHRFAAHPTGSCKCTMSFVTELRPGDRWLGPYGSRPNSAAQKKEKV